MPTRTCPSGNICRISENAPSNQPRQRKVCHLLHVQKTINTKTLTSDIMWDFILRLLELSSEFNLPELPGCVLSDPGDSDRAIRVQQINVL